MKFKAKLRQIRNSQGVYIPLKVITDYTLGEEIELEIIASKAKVITPKKEVITNPEKVITSVITNPTSNKKWQWCKKHSVSIFTCGCKQCLRF